MTQALFTSMTGLNAGTEQLTVVSDNVANMNTTAYKTSRVDFQDVWYATKTTGTNSSRVSGGTNPYQIGVGVQCASITKDFSASSTNTTGRSEDMAITGNGWFTIQNSDGKVLLTRDGTFSLDENGFLCTADGSKVLGMDQMESLTNSTIPIKMPTSIKVVVEGTPKAKFDAMKCSELNALGSSNSGIRDGEFGVTVKVKNPDDTVSTVKLKVNVGTDVNDGSVAAMVAAMNASTTNGTDADGNPVTYKVSDYFTVASENGTISFTPKAGVESLEFNSIEEKDGGTNFVSIAKLANMPLVDGKYTSDPLNLSATIGQVDDITSEYTQNYDSFSVGKDGLVTVTYGDGSILTVKSNDDGSTYFSYQTSAGVIINDDIQNSGNASLYVDPNVLVKANMQLQLAKVLNDGGLIAEGNNQYSVGVNCGDVIYTAANINGVGGVVTGALEASNVDLAQQFSNMILAQRLVQANSQVFSGANQLLETLVYLGQ
ncbi:MAG: flagellar hook-basal body complex protein [Candidatus Gastranaerophilales bacterium]|nr:flagellar hook-basal body complex protein [Candidatus Gastranaerophilales bacterium]